MKKKAIIIISIALLIAIAFGTAFSIDMHRMNSNKPVLFSSWGYDYTPPTEQNDYPLGTSEYKHSFVGEVLEETTTYMIVKPIRDKSDEPSLPKGDKAKIEYGTDHYDYLYGIGRKCVIYYEDKPEVSSDGMETIRTEDISTEGFREFELNVTPSHEKIKKQIIERTSPTDSTGKLWTYGDAALYYYGMDNVEITIKGFTMPLEYALEQGRITLQGLIAKANQDVIDDEIPELVYKDGGSQVYKYPDYTIIKYHTLDGNRDVYIGSSDMDIDIKNK